MKWVKQYILDILVIIIISSFGIFLFLHRNYYEVPNSDIFQYINDAATYKNGLVPPNIQVPPGIPILISFISTLFPFYPYPEIFSAHLINFISSITILSLLYLLFKAYSKRVAFLLVLLVMTNPLFIFSSLDVNTEVSFCAAFLLISICYKRGHILIAYILAGLSSSIRYEAIIFVLALLIIDIFTRTPVKKVTLYLVSSIIPICLILLFINSSYYPGSIFQNSYIKEIQDNSTHIPHIILEKSLPFIMIDGYENFILAKIILYTSLIVGAFIVFIKGDRTLKFIVITTFGYLLLHSFFPFVPDRYVYPVLWSLYMFPLLGVTFITNFNKPKTYLLLWIPCMFIIYLIISSNIQRTFSYIQNSNLITASYSGKKGKEDRLAADWLTHNISEPTIVIIYEPWITSYYTHNPYITFLLQKPFQLYQACNDLLCVINSIKKETDNQNIIVILLDRSNRDSDYSYPSAFNFNVSIFNSFPQQHEVKYFQLINTLNNNSVRIYKYTPH